MGCIYQDFNGKCQQWDDSIEMPGCDDEGDCICSDDPDPGYLCGEYESDNTCSECGADLNIEDCGCDV